MLQNVDIFTLTVNINEKCKKMSDLSKCATNVKKDVKDWGSWRLLLQADISPQTLERALILS